MKEYDKQKLRSDLKINFGRAYQQCVKTVMDTIADPNISFDEEGVSNYYHNYRQYDKYSKQSRDSLNQQLVELTDRIKAEGKRKKYNCITGISGGVDSSYLAYLAKELGLNPLIVHFDNGWNSETAVKNVQSIIDATGFDLYTLVVDWNEFKDLQLSYFKANVVDIEVLTDHAISATLYRLARQENVKYILSGNNYVTEAILPSYWTFNKGDSKNIKAIHARFGSAQLKTYPFASLKMRKIYSDVYGIKVIELLNYVDYNKTEAKKLIANKLAWKDYGGKHAESIFTRFYQGYILPNKFSIDKRKAHLSTLICSGQMQRGQAIEELQLPMYDQQQLMIDKEFVLKKLGFSSLSFDRYMEMPRQEHTDYDYEVGFFAQYPFLKPLKRLFAKRYKQ